MELGPLDLRHDVVYQTKPYVVRQEPKGRYSCSSLKVELDSCIFPLLPYDSLLTLRFGWNG